jgi:hypothetical protein
MKKSTFARNFSTPFSLLRSRQPPKLLYAMGVVPWQWQHEAAIDDR